MTLPSADINALILGAMDRISPGLRSCFDGFHLDNGILTLTMGACGDDLDSASWQPRLQADILTLLKGVKTVRFLSTHHRTGTTAAAKSCGTKKESNPGSIPKLAFPTIGRLIAVGSGKGGVGKSAVTVNLARSLARQGLKVGILDADIYGPSLPTMMGLKERPSLTEQGKLKPLIKDGIHVMSMGFFLKTQGPLIWRGPMVSSSLTQLFRDVDWGILDVLLIDLPPGTGDVHLTLAQKIPLNGAIIVSTPQDLALIDARKGLEMFQTLGVPIIGVIENMATFHCPHCAHETPIFNTNRVESLCETLAVPYLGAVPIDMAIRIAADAGVALDPTSPAANCFDGIAAHFMNGETTKHTAHI